MKFLFRAALAVLLLLGVYVLAVALLVLPGVGVWQAAVHGTNGALVLKLGLLALGIAVPILVALWKVARTGSEEPGGLPLAEQDHPALWEETREIARAVGTRAPDEIRLLPEVNAAVWERSRLLGLVGGRRVMTLGAPLLQGLSRQQLRSVLAHELGHYSHRHTALSPVVYRGHLTIGHIVAGLGEDSWSGRLFAAYGRLYLRVSTSITRRQEKEADGWSHRIAGRDAAASAMREVPALDGIWSFFLEHYAFAVQGARPDALLRGFGALLEDPTRQQQMADHRRELPEEPPGRYDSHPSTSSRVAWFESLPDDGVADDGTPARELLGDHDATYLRLETALFAESELDAQSWEWIAHASGQQRSRAGAALLVRASHEHGSGASTLRDALVGLSMGRARSLLRPYLDIDTPPDAVDGAARRMVSDMAALALVEHCGARFAVEWDGRVALVDSAGEPVDVAGLVSAAVEEGSATWLLSALEDEGVPPSYSIELTEEEAPGGGRTPAVEAVAVCAEWRRMRVVVVAENALVIKRMRKREALAVATLPGRQAHEKALHHVASTPLEELLADPRSDIHAWSRVHSARLSRRRLEVVVDGRVRRLRVRREAVLGDLAGALTDHLGQHALAT